MKSKYKIRGLTDESNMELNKAVLTQIRNIVNVPQTAYTAFNTPLDDIHLAVRKTNRNIVSLYISVKDKESIREHKKEYIDSRDYTNLSTVFEDPNYVKIESYGNKVKRVLDIEFHSGDRREIESIESKLNNIAYRGSIDLKYPLDENMVNFINHIREAKNTLLFDADDVSMENYLPVDKKEVKRLSAYEIKFKKKKPIESKDFEYTLAITVEVVYNRDLLLFIDHSILFNNTVLDTKFMKTLGKFSSTSNKYIVKELGDIYTTYLTDQDLNFNLPINDNFVPPVQNENYVALATIALPLDDRLDTLGNLKTLPGLYIPEELLTYMFDKKSMLTTYNSGIAIELYKDNELITNLLNILDDGTLVSKEKLDVTKIYRLVILRAKNATTMDASEWDRFKLSFGEDFDSVLVYINANDVKDFNFNTAHLEWLEAYLSQLSEFDLIPFRATALPELYHTGNVPEVVEEIDENSWNVKVPVIKSFKVAPNNTEEVTSFQDFTGILKCNPMETEGRYPGVLEKVEWRIGFTNTDNPDLDRDAFKGGSWESIYTPGLELNITNRPEIKPGNKIFVIAKFWTDYEDLDLESQWSTEYSIEIPARDGLSLEPMTLNKTSNSDTEEYYIDLEAEALQSVTNTPIVGEAKVNTLTYKIMKDDTEVLSKVITDPKIEPNTSVRLKHRFVLPEGTTPGEYKAIIEIESTNAWYIKHNINKAKVEKNFRLEATEVPEDTTNLPETVDKLVITSPGYESGSNNIGDFTGILHTSEFRPRPGHEGEIEYLEFRISHSPFDPDIKYTNSSIKFTKDRLPTTEGKLNLATIGNILYPAHALFVKARYITKTADGRKARSPWSDDFIIQVPDYGIINITASGEYSQNGKYLVVTKDVTLNNPFEDIIGRVRVKDTKVNLYKEPTNELIYTGTFKRSSNTYNIPTVKLTEGTKYKVEVVAEVDNLKLRQVSMSYKFAFEKAEFKWNVTELPEANDWEIGTPEVKEILKYDAANQDPYEYTGIIRYKPMEKLGDYPGTLNRGIFRYCVSDNPTVDEATDTIKQNDIDISRFEGQPAIDIDIASIDLTDRFMPKAGQYFHVQTQWEGIIQPSQRKLLSETSGWYTHKVPELGIKDCRIVAARGERDVTFTVVTELHKYNHRVYGWINTPSKITLVIESEDNTEDLRLEYELEDRSARTATVVSLPKTVPLSTFQDNKYYNLKVEYTLPDGNWMKWVSEDKLESCKHRTVTKRWQYYVGVRDKAEWHVAKPSILEIKDYQGVNKPETFSNVIVTSDFIPRRGYPGELEFAKFHIWSTATGDKDDTPNTELTFQSLPIHYKDNRVEIPIPWSETLKLVPERTYFLTVKFHSFFMDVRKETEESEVFSFVAPKLGLKNMKVLPIVDEDSEYVDINLAPTEYNHNVKALGTLLRSARFNVTIAKEDEPDTILKRGIGYGLLAKIPFEGLEEGIKYKIDITNYTYTGVLANLLAADAVNAERYSYNKATIWNCTRATEPGIAKPVISINNPDGFDGKIKFSPFDPVVGYAGEFVSYTISIFELPKSGGRLPEVVEQIEENPNNITINYDPDVGLQPYDLNGNKQLRFEKLYGVYVKYKGKEVIDGEDVYKESLWSRVFTVIIETPILDAMTPTPVVDGEYIEIPMIRRYQRVYPGLLSGTETYTMAISSPLGAIPMEDITIEGNVAKIHNSKLIKKNTYTFAFTYKLANAWLESIIDLGLGTTALTQCGATNNWETPIGNYTVNQSGQTTIVESSGKLGLPNLLLNGIEVQDLSLLELNIAYKKFDTEPTELNDTNVIPSDAKKVTLNATNWSDWCLYDQEGFEYDKWYAITGNYKVGYTGNNGRTEETTYSNFYMLQIKKPVLKLTEPTVDLTNGLHLMASTNPSVENDKPLYFGDFNSFYMLKMQIYKIQEDNTLEFAGESVKIGNITGWVFKYPWDTLSDNTNYKVVITMSTTDDKHIRNGLETVSIEKTFRLGLKPFRPGWGIAKPVARHLPATNEQTGIGFTGIRNPSGTIDLGFYRPVNRFPGVQAGTEIEVAKVPDTVFDTWTDYETEVANTWDTYKINNPGIVSGILPANGNLTGIRYNMPIALSLTNQLRGYHYITRARYYSMYDNPDGPKVFSDWGYFDTKWEHPVITPKIKTVEYVEENTLLAITPEIDLTNYYYFNKESNIGNVIITMVEKANPSTALRVTLTDGKGYVQMANVKEGVEYNIKVQFVPTSPWVTANYSSAEIDSLFVEQTWSVEKKPFSTKWKVVKPEIAEATTRVSDTDVKTGKVNISAYTVEFGFPGELKQLEYEVIKDKTGVETDFDITAASTWETTEKLAKTFTSRTNLDLYSLLKENETNFPPYEPIYVRARYVSNYKKTDSDPEMASEWSAPLKVKYDKPTLNLTRELTDSADKLYQNIGLTYGLSNYYTFFGELNYTTEISMVKASDESVTVPMNVVPGGYRFRYLDIEEGVEYKLTIKVTLVNPVLNALGITSKIIEETYKKDEIPFIANPNWAIEKPVVSIPASYNKEEPGITFNGKYSTTYNVKESYPGNLDKSSWSIQWATTRDFTQGYGYTSYPITLVKRDLKPGEVSTFKMESDYDLATFKIPNNYRKADIYYKVTATHASEFKKHPLTSLASEASEIVYVPKIGVKSNSFEYEIDGSDLLVTVTTETYPYNTTYIPEEMVYEHKVEVLDGNTVVTSAIANEHNIATIDIAPIKFKYDYKIRVTSVLKSPVIDRASTAVKESPFRIEQHPTWRLDIPKLRFNGGYDGSEANFKNFNGKIDIIDLRGLGGYDGKVTECKLYLKEVEYITDPAKSAKRHPTKVLSPMTLTMDVTKTPITYDLFNDLRVKDNLDWGMKLTFEAEYKTEKMRDGTKYEMISAMSEELELTIPYKTGLTELEFKAETDYDYLKVTAKPTIEIPNKYLMGKTDTYYVLLSILDENKNVIESDISPDTDGTYLRTLRDLPLDKPYTIYATYQLDNVWLKDRKRFIISKSITYRSPATLPALKGKRVEIPQGPGRTEIAAYNINLDFNNLKIQPDEFKFTKKVEE